MAEYSANATQIVNPGETIVFTTTDIPCGRGFVRHRDGSGSFLLSGWIPRQYGCPCCRAKQANYLVDFGANISIPTGGTVGPISVAIAIDGATLPSTTMEVTPAAVNESFNVSRATNLQIWANCCETVSVRNTSDQAIQVSKANVIFTRPDLFMSR